MPIALRCPMIQITGGSICFNAGAHAGKPAFDVACRGRERGARYRTYNCACLVGRTRPEVSDQEHLRYGQIRQRECIGAYRKSMVPRYGLAGILAGFSRTLPMLSSAVSKCVAYSRTRRASCSLGVLGAVKASAATGDVGRR